jgi:hypothetical protein
VVRVLMGDNDGVDQIGIDRECDECSRTGVTPNASAGLLYEVSGSRTAGNREGSR